MARPESMTIVAMPLRTLVCLANSRKGNGFCFAGVDVDTLEWFRPVGSGWEGAVLANEQTLQDGSAPKLLEVIEVPLSGPAPEPGQPENWSIATGKAWRGIDRLKEGPARELLTELSTSEPLFGNRGKALTPDAMQALDHSLAIVNPQEITWRREGSKKLYAVFEHCNRELALSVSDPVCFDVFRREAPGDHTWGAEATQYLTVSVTAHPWNGFHWKLVAGVMNLPAG